MSTYNKWAKSPVRIYGVITVLTAAFSIIYEYNSHGVYSVYMITLPLYPLLAGVLVFGIIYHWKKEIRLPWICRCGYHSAVAAFMMGSCLKGVVEIYGTSSGYIDYYRDIGKLMIIVSVLSLCHAKFK